MRSRLIFFCYVEIDLFVVEMFFEDLFDIVFAIEDCNSHVFVSFYNDELVMFSELTKGRVLKAGDVGSRFFLMLCGFSINPVCKLVHGFFDLLASFGRIPKWISDVEFWIEILVLFNIAKRVFDEVFCTYIFYQPVDGIVYFVCWKVVLDTKLETEREE